MAPRELNLKRVREGLDQFRQFRANAVNAYAPEFKVWQERVRQALAELLPTSSYARRFSNLYFCLPRMQPLTSDSRSVTPLWTDFDQEQYDSDAKMADELLSAALEEADLLEEARPSPAVDRCFVDPSRIQALRSKTGGSHDLKRLARLCEELNLCYASECYLAVAALTRAVLDHVPPLLGFSSFAEVANNYRGGKSFSQSMSRLENSARNIADRHLHQSIRSREDLPARTQVDFSHDLDGLLSEIIRIL